MRCKAARGSDVSTVWSDDGEHFQQNTPTSGARSLGLASELVFYRASDSVLGFGETRGWRCNWMFVSLPWLPSLGPPLLTFVLWSPGHPVFRLRENNLAEASLCSVSHVAAQTADDVFRTVHHVITHFIILKYCVCIKYMYVCLYNICMTYIYIYIYIYYTYCIIYVYQLYFKVTHHCIPARKQGQALALPLLVD